MGMIYQRGSKFWIKYYRNGAPIRESTGSDKEGVAKDLLKKREGAIACGVPVTPRMNRCTIDELLADVVTDYKVNGKRSLSDLEGRIENHLRPFFSGAKAANVTTAVVRRYVERRQAENAGNATINRELAILKRAFSLAAQSSKVMAKPHVPMLRENNVRTGFFEPEQFTSVRSHLPEPLRPVVTFAYLTGWRVRSEILPMQWRQVDFAAGWVRLEVGTTKNGEGRAFPFTPELRALLEAQRTYTDAVQRETGSIIPHVFHRAGKPIHYFRRSWKTACKAAGVPGYIPHDFRRTAVRALVRASIPERVAMTMTGHKTRSVFERYNIVSEGDLRAAAEKLTGTISGTVAKGLAGTARALPRK